MSNPHLEAKAALDKGHYAALGKIASAWASFELAIDRQIWKLAGVTNSIGACVTGQLIGHAKRLDALTCLVRLHGGSDKLIASISSFGQSSYNVAEERNRAMHDPWFVNHETGNIARLQISAKKELKFGLEMQSADELLTIVAKIEDRVSRFSEIGRAIEAELGPFPRTPPQEPFDLIYPS